MVNAHVRLLVKKGSEYLGVVQLLEVYKLAVFDVLQEVLCMWISQLCFILLHHQSCLNMQLATCSEQLHG